MLLEPEERERRRLEERAAWTVKRIRGVCILTMYFGVIPINGASS